MTSYTVDPFHKTWKR